ncbi:MAG: hypothetical protein QUS12_12920, partial [Methanosarcina sp.]|nr:hypothetical protein [Methanosarcina sp.]
MEIKTESKKVTVFQVVLCIAVVALLAVVIYQNRRFNLLSTDSIEETQDKNVTSKKAIDIPAVQDKQATADNSKAPDATGNPGEKTGDNSHIKVSSAKPVSGEENNQSSGQVGNIMGKLASEIQNNPAMESMIRNQLTTRLNGIYDSFAEEYNLSPEKKAGLINLLAEKQMETLDMATQIGDMQNGKVSAETLQKEGEYVNNLYDTKISELLNPKEFEAYREYSKYESERFFLREFKRSIEYTGGTAINREQEKELVSAMYNERQKHTEMQKDVQQSMNPNAPVLSKENLEK